MKSFSFALLMASTLADNKIWTYSEEYGARAFADGVDGGFSYSIESNTKVKDDSFSTDVKSALEV